MKKAFFLLRDNKQLGPFTIDELLQHKLSNLDLIWVDGYSHTWCLPTELDLLKLSIAETATGTENKPSATGEKVNQSSNSVILKNKKKRKWADEDIETRAEEIRRRTLEYVATKNHITNTVITDKEIGSFVKTPDIDFVVHKKSKGISANFVGASLVALMLVAGWYGKDKFFIAQNSDILNTQAVTPQVIPISSTIQMPPSQNESAAFSDEENLETVELVEEEKTSIPVNRSLEAKPVAVASMTDKGNKIDESIKTDKPPVKEIEDQIVQPETKETPVISSKTDSSKSINIKSKEETKVEEETEESIEKKKTLGQAIKGIFKKKKKDKDTEEEND